MKNRERVLKALEKLIEKYISTIHEELDERWQKLNIDLSHSESYEVVGALLARQVTLASHFARVPDLWNPHIAPMFFRVMVDVYINLTWILDDVHERARKFILFGLGQLKLTLEHRRAELLSDRQNPDDDQLIQAMESWINAQRYEFLVEVDVGHWADINTRTMAEQADCLDIYRYAYTPFSAAVHSMWSHIGIWNLKECENPLHKFHKVPDDSDLPPDVDFLIKAAKYVSKSFRKFDSSLGIESTVPDGYELLTKGLDELFAAS